VLEIITQPTAAPPRARCRVARCRAAATHTPILCIALLGSGRVSRLALPTDVCSGHRAAFSEGFLSPARRATMEASLRARGRGAPDWARTHVDFVTS
jgi:hypothetical protein